MPRLAATSTGGVVVAMQADGLLDPLVEARAVRQIGLCIDMGKAQDLPLALRDVFAHPVEAIGQRAGLDTLRDDDRLGVVTGAHPFGPGPKLRKRPRDPAGNEVAERHQDADAGHGQHRQELVQAIVASQQLIDRALQDGHALRIAGSVERHEPGAVLVIAEHDTLNATARRIRRDATQAVEQRLAMPGCNRGPQQPRAAAIAQHEAQFEAGQCLEVRREAIIDPEADCDPCDRHRRQDGHDDDLVKPPGLGNDP
jgi:hypothetical protein